MMSSPCISVLLPVRNAARTVRRAIDSLEASAFDDVEVIAIDDASTDGSAEVLVELAATRPWLRVLRQDFGGIVVALNHGLQHALGAYIARMDADDESLPGRLRAQREYLDMNDDIGLVAGLVEFVGNREMAGGYAHYVDWTNSLRNHDDISFQRFVESPFAHPSVMFRKSLMECYGTYRGGEFPEDYELWLRWLDAGVRVSKLPLPVLRWFDHPERLSRNDSRYSLEAFYRIKAGYIAKWLFRYASTWPDVIVWGAGRTTRKRAAFLMQYGVRIRAWVDIDQDKTGRWVNGLRVIDPSELPSPGTCFILPYVGSRHAREHIMAWLDAHKYVRLRDYIPAA